MPFSKVLFVYGEPIEVPRKLDGQGAENYRMIVEQSLKDLMELGEREFEQLYKSGEKRESRAFPSPRRSGERAG